MGLDLQPRRGDKLVTCAHGKKYSSFILRRHANFYQVTMPGGIAGIEIDCPFCGETRKGSSENYSEYGTSCYCTAFHMRTGVTLYLLKSKPNFLQRVRFKILALLSND